VTGVREDLYIGKWVLLRVLRPSRVAGLNSISHNSHAMCKYSISNCADVESMCFDCKVIYGVVGKQRTVTLQVGVEA